MTFAFTDIEGDTHRWDRDRAAMKPRSAGTTISCARRSPSTAATSSRHSATGSARPFRGRACGAALLAAQRALAAENFSAVDGLRVRAAVHTGTADERDGDYFGPTLNRVARLLGIGHGGQVLVSGVTADLVQATCRRRPACATSASSGCVTFRGRNGSTN